MKRITHPVAIRILDELYEKGFTTNQGTYNPNDPTHWEHRELEHQGHELQMKNVTWGTTFILDGREILYVSYGCFGTKTDIIVRDGYRFGDWVLLQRINSNTPWPEPETFEMDPAGGYGLWSHE